MSRFFKKKRKKDVEYEELKKGEAFKIKVGKANIVAWRYPQYKYVEAKGEAAVLPGKVEGEYKRREYGIWDVVIKTEDLPLMPLDEWKKKVSETLSVATATHVSPGTVQISGSALVSTIEGTMNICPNCKKPLFVVGLAYCPNCGSKL